MLTKIGWILGVVGALNWGLVGIGYFINGLNLNIVNLLLGNWAGVENIVYILVGIGGITLITSCSCKKCTTSGSQM